MRLWNAIPLSFFAVLPPRVFADSAAQVSLESPPKTLVEALSADPDYTLLLHLLQRARLIPTLNKLNGSTFFAPTNDAVKRHSSSNSLWMNALHDHTMPYADNINEQLRQDLFYHLLNYSIVLPAEQDVLTLKTLHFPHIPPEPPTREPPPHPPWMPIPGGTLGGEPQRLRLGARDGELRVGVDAFGEGGAKLVKGQVDAGNGILLGIDDVLPVPTNLGRSLVGFGSFRTPFSPAVSHSKHRRVSLLCLLLSQDSHTRDHRPSQFLFRAHPLPSRGHCMGRP